MTYYMPRKFAEGFVVFLLVAGIVLGILVGISKCSHSDVKNVDVDEYVADDSGLIANIVSFEPVYVITQYDRYGSNSTSKDEEYICKCRTEAGKTVWLSISKEGYLNRIKCYTNSYPEKVLVNEEGGELTFSEPIRLSECKAIPAKRIDAKLYDELGAVLILSAKETIVNIQASWKDRP